MPKPTESKLQASRERSDRAEFNSEIMTGGIIELEGIFGMSYHLVSQTALFTASMASTALGVVTDLPCRLVGRIMFVDCDDSTLRGGRVVKTHRKKEIVTPTMIFKMFQSIVPRSIWSAFSPTVGNRKSSNTSMDNGKEKYFVQCNNSNDNTKALTIEAADTAQNECQNGHIDSSSTAHSYSTSSLSTMSDNGGGTDDFPSEGPTNTYDDDRECTEFVTHSDPKQSLSDYCTTTAKALHVDVNATKQKERIDGAQAWPETYYLNVSSLLSQVDQDNVQSLPLTQDCKNDTFFVLKNAFSHQQDMEAFRFMLDAVVRNALDLTRDDDVPSDFSHDETKACPLWKPEGDTKKILQRILRSKTRHDNHDESINLLETTVLKWTGVVKNQNEEVRMIKTRGIVDMSPLELKNLLIDCKRGHLVNKNSLGKRDVCVFPCDVGTTTIVENTLKIPIVGGEIHSVSLTHSRLVENDSGNTNSCYVIVSKSVQRELNQSTTTQQLPYYSVSVLRPVGDKTDLVNVAQISQVPVPKFLVNKIAFTSAVDFFNNLRSIT